MINPTVTPPSRWRTMRRFTRLRMHAVVLWILGGWWVYGIVAGYNMPKYDSEEFDPSAQESALHVWDRIHRLNAALENQPRWQQWLLGYEEPQDLLLDTQDSLEIIFHQNQLNERGNSTLSLIRHVLQQSNDGDMSIEPIIFDSISLTPLNRRQWQEWENRLVSEGTPWWEMEFAEKISHAQGVHDLDDEMVRQRQQNDRIFTQTLVTTLATYAVFVAGLCVLPRGLRKWRASSRAVKSSKVRRYSERISLSLLVVLLIGSDMTNNWLLGKIAQWGAAFSGQWWWEMAIDTCWRLLPVAVLLWFLYRKPAWIARSFGLLRRPQWSIILSLFALLLLVDFGLMLVMDPFESSDVTSGFDPLEHGWSGLAYGIMSTCLIAPIAEEFIYRGFLFQGMLRKAGFWLAAGVSSLVFALSHFYDVHGTISVGLFGLTAALLYRATRSLTNAILLHVLYNLTITVPSWFLFHSP